jgi:hypothetical protein
MESIEKLIEYIKYKYSCLELENVGGYKNIKRYTKPIMSEYVENAVAIFINDVLKNKKLNFCIDPQLSVGERNPKRPDIIIYNNNNEILGIVEVKSQLGYSHDFNSKDYYKRIKKMKAASKKGLLRLKNEEPKTEEDKYIYFTISKKCIDFVVILTAENGHKNLEKYKKVNHYLLFNKGIWYNEMPINSLNHGENGIEGLINTIKRIGD